MEDAMLEANHNLSKEVTRLKEELGEYYRFKEMWERDQHALREMERRLESKYNTVRIVMRKDNALYVQQIVKMDDTSEGLFIEIADSQNSGGKG